MSRPVFRVGLNPEEESSLPYLLEIPVEGGVILKAREPWPSSSRVYCHPWEGPWPDEAEVLEEVPVRHCARRGPAIDLVLDRGQRNRAQFLYPRTHGVDVGSVKERYGVDLEIPFSFAA